MRKTNYLVPWAGLLFTTLFLLLTPLITSVFASQISVQVSPLTLEYTLSPGQSQEGVITFYNPSDTPQVISPQIWDFTPSDETGGLRIFHDPSWQFSASKWILFDGSSFTLEPKTEKRLPFTIVVPKEAEPGSHYAALFGEAQPRLVPEGDSGETLLIPEVKIKFHVGAGTLFLINIPGNFLREETSYGGTIVSFEIQGLKRDKILQVLGRLIQIPTGLVSTAPLTFVARFQNTGIFHQTPKGVIEVFNVLGKKVSTLSIPAQRVLPGAIIQFRSQWLPSLLIGPYKAKLIVFYGKDSYLRVESEKRFLAFSSIALGLLGIGLVVILGIIIFQKRSKT